MKMVLLSLRLRLRSGLRQRGIVHLEAYPALRLRSLRSLASGWANSNTVHLSENVPWKLRAGAVVWD
jgi:hypothetical protein